MGSGPSEGTINFEALSDDELIQLLPIKIKRVKGSPTKPAAQKFEELGLTPEQFEAMNELWRRHEGMIRDYLRRKVFQPGSTLCPEGEDRESFFKCCVQEAYVVFLRRVRSEQYSNFPAFLRTVAINTALDVRKEIEHRIGEDKDECGGGVHLIRDIDELLDTLVAPGSDPLENVVVRERRKILLLALYRYANESPRNEVSLAAVCRKALDRFTWAQIADKFLPPKGEQTEAARVRAGKQFVGADAEGIENVLEREFGIKSIRVFF